MQVNYTYKSIYQSNSAAASCCGEGCDFLQVTAQGLIVYFANHLAHLSPNDDDVIVNEKKEIVQTRSTNANSHSVYERGTDGKETLANTLQFTNEDGVETGMNRITPLEAVNKAYAMNSIRQNLEPSNGLYQNIDGLSRDAIKTLNIKLNNISHKRVTINNQNLYKHKSLGIYLGSIQNLQLNDGFRMLYQFTPIIKFSNEIF